MSLIKRITRLCKADLHGLLDDLEEPEAVVKQAIREMEDDIAQQEQRLAELHAIQARLTRESEELTEALQSLEGQIELCFTADNEALARSLIRKRLEMTQRARSLARAQAEAQSRHEALTQSLATHKQQLAAVVQQLALLLATQQPRAWSAPGTGQSGSVVTDDEVEVAFLEEKQRRMRYATSNPV